MSDTPSNLDPKPIEQDGLIPVTENVKDRLSRLEDMVAYLCDSEAMEARVADRLKRQLALPPVNAAPLARPALPQAEAGVVVAQPLPNPPSVSLMDFALPPPVAPLVTLPPGENQSSKTSSFQSSWQAAKLFSKIIPETSILRDLWWDLRTGFAMFRDPLYPMTMACRIIPLFALLYVTIWPLFSSWGGIFGTVFNGLVNAMVLFLAFKVLQRELKRYYGFVEKYRQ